MNFFPPSNIPYIILKMGSIGDNKITQLMEMIPSKQSIDNVIDSVSTGMAIGISYLMWANQIKEDPKQGLLNATIVAPIFVAGTKGCIESYPTMRYIFPLTYGLYGFSAFINMNK